MHVHYQVILQLGSKLKAKRFDRSLEFSWCYRKQTNAFLQIFPPTEGKTYVVFQNSKTIFNFIFQRHKERTKIVFIWFHVIIFHDKFSCEFWRVGTTISRVLPRRSRLDVVCDVKTLVWRRKRLADGCSDSRIESRTVYEMRSRISFTCGQNVRVNDNLLSENSLTTQKRERRH